MIVYPPVRTDEGICIQVLTDTDSTSKIHIFKNEPEAWNFYSTFKTEDLSWQHPSVTSIS